MQSFKNKDETKSGIWSFGVRHFCSPIFPSGLKLLGYPTSVVEGVGDEFISVRESLIS